MQRTYTITVEESKPGVKVDSPARFGREKKVEATRQFVLTVCIISGAIAAFQMPLLKGLGNTSYAFAAIATSIACCLIVILVGVLHLAILYYVDLYTDDAGGGTNGGDIFFLIKRFLSWIVGFISECDKLNAAVSWAWPFLRVRGCFSLLLIGVMFSLGLSISIAFLVMRAKGIA